MTEDRLGEGMGGRKLKDEDGGRWSGGKVRALTEVEIEQEGRGNSIVLYRKVDDSAERQKTRTGEEGAATIVSVVNSEGS